MRKSLALLAVAAALFTADRALAEDHLVTGASVQARLSEAAAERERDLTLVDRALSSPQASAAASALGTDIDRVRAAVPALSDQELRDVAARASALGTDPVAGLDEDIRTLLIIFLIVAIVLIVLKAVA